MVFQPEPDGIVWRLHLASPPESVYQALGSDDGRASFWAESAEEHNGVIHFEFINGERYTARIIGSPPYAYRRPRWRWRPEP